MAPYFLFDLPAVLRAIAIAWALGLVFISVRMFCEMAALLEPLRSGMVVSFRANYTRLRFSHLLAFAPADTRTEEAAPLGESLPGDRDGEDFAAISTDDGHARGTYLRLSACG
jgi:hypothetical protein